MATIRKLRRDTYATLLGVTGSEDEIGYASDKGRVVFFDGVTAGPSFILPTVTDILLNNFTVAVCTGTDTLTASLLKAPAAYASYMQVLIIAANDNTGAVTLNLNSLGAKDVKKMTSSGLAALAGGDFKAGGAYPAVYDGTRFIVVGGAIGGNGSLWEPINTVSASGAATVDFNNLLDSTYDTYRIDAENVVLSTAMDVTVRAGYGGSPTYVSASYRTIFISADSNTATPAGSNSITGGFPVMPNGQSGAATSGAFSFEISGCNFTSRQKHATARASVPVAGGHVSVVNMAGQAENTNLVNNALTSLRVNPSTGTITGNFTLSGLKRAA